MVFPVTTTIGKQYSETPHAKQQRKHLQIVLRGGGWGGGGGLVGMGCFLIFAT